MGSGAGVAVGEGVSVGESGVGVEDVQEASSRLMLKNEARNLFIVSFLVENPMLFVGPDLESGHLY